MDSLIGKTVDSYRILEVIGRGGMGVVFKALDTNLEKVVALKMIDPFLARDENFVRRFKTEAKALAKLENPNIVGVYALRETDAGFFMVMEYVESVPLSQYLQENGPFNISDAVSITKQLLNAIGHAHKVGVIHRDIKPSNILLSDKNKIKVTDFGLAKVVEQKGPASTVTQARAGTLYYMSPEQVKGLKNVDLRSDLYSLGMTVYEMIAGRVPFDKTDSDFTIQKIIVDGEIPSPVKFNAGIPKKFTKIISRSINKDPDKRYQTADEMLEDIYSFEREYHPEKSKGKAQDTTIIERVVKEPTVKQSSKFDFKKPAILFPSIAAIVLLAVLLFLFLPGGSSTDDTYLSITSNPSDADIMLNQKSIGVSPIKDFKLESAGEISLSVAKDGFISVDTTIVIEAGRNENISFNLNPVQKERISITTNPSGAKLFVDGNPVNNSPIENYSITSGRHNIRVEKAGFNTLDTEIDVRKESSKQFNFTLTKDPDFKGFGILKIDSNPPGATVFLNGEAVGKTPFLNNEQPVADYNLVLRQDGFTDYTESFKILLNKTKTINKKLSSTAETSAEQFGRLKITSKPSEASVYLDGAFVGSTPFNNSKTIAGKHKLVIKKKGFADYSETIEVEVNKTTTFSAELISSSGTLGKVEILVRPYGSIYINDELKAQDTNSPFNTELPAGRYRIKLTHPTLGSTPTMTINVTGGSQKFVYDLSRIAKLTLISNPPYCEIFINGSSTGKYTPVQLQLKPGTYKIVLKKDGYINSKEEKYEVPYSIYEAANDREDRKEFELTKSK
ncbi:MAG: serine/threonine protein kinase [Ignavibacterium sp.]|nr:serine/threonine protein kinase [Ignavibacterium sp.]